MNKTQIKKWFRRHGKKSETWYCTDVRSFETLKDAMPYYDNMVITKPKARVSIAIKSTGVWVETYERKRGAH